MIDKEIDEKNRRFISETVEKDYPEWIKALRDNISNIAKDYKTVLSDESRRVLRYSLILALVCDALAIVLGIIANIGIWLF